MIPNRIRESRRTKSAKLPKHLKRMFIEGKCRECAVVVTRMDFAKILGKFTKVKIQYESSTLPKTNQNSQLASPKPTSRLKSNENGMVQIRRNAYNEHPVKELTATKKSKVVSPRLTPNILKENNRLKKAIPIAKNINNNNNNSNLLKKNNINLKEYGIVFQDPLLHMHSNVNDVSSKISLSDLLSQINESILPSEDWCIDFFPKKGELKDDKVYDRIAAELEDLMYNEKPAKSNEKLGIIETKVDDFPSIMDILNDNTRDVKTNDQNSCLEYKPNLESSDVEAMLLGKSDPTSDPIPPTPMEVDSSDMSNLIEDVTQLTANQDNGHMESVDKLPASDIKLEEIENPQSPSILDEALKKGIEEHLPSNPVKLAEESALIKDDMSSGENAETKVDNIENKVVGEVIETASESNETIETTSECNEPIGQTNESIETIGTTSESKEIIETTDESKENIGTTDESKEIIETTNESKENIETANESKEINKTSSESKETIDTINKESAPKQACSFASIEGITHLVFKKTKDGNCFKTVTCPKNLKYDIEINGKSVEFIGAPKFISSVEDLQVLLQIVNESELDSLYVLH